MPASDRKAYTVTRLSGAPQRRAGRIWSPGETIAELTDAEAAIVRRDPLYRLEPLALVATVEVESAKPEAAAEPSPARRARKGKGAA